MDSRLLRSNKVLLPILILLFMGHSPLHAQNFIFSFLGPDTIYVDNTCTAPYGFNGDSVQILSTINAEVTWEYDWQRAGFNYDDFFIAGSTATMYAPTWDNQGNIDTFTFDIYFADTIAPIFDVASLPANFPFYNYISDVPPPANVTATDNCSPVTISYNQSTLTDTCAGGSFFRTWTAIDTFGNQSIYTQTLILNPDQTPPQITQWPNNGHSACEVYDLNISTWLAQNINTIQANDPSGIASITHNAPTNLQFTCDTTFVVTFSVTDSCGNTKYAPASFQVVDTVAPVIINPPTDDTYNCNQIVSAVHLGNGLNTSDCDQNLIEIFSESNTQNPNPQSCSHYNYSITRNWIIKDHCGNQTTFQQILTIQDTMAPVFNTSLQGLTTQCQDVPIFQDLTATDECALVSYQKDEDIILGNCAETYEIIRTWTAYDVCGNQNQITQNIQVIDTIAPVFQNIPLPITVNCNNIPNFSTLTATDSCDNDVFITQNELSTQSSNPSDCGYYNYTITRNWLAADNCGNHTQATQTITVIDDEAPEIVCPQNIIQINDTLSCTSSMLLPNPASYFDNCTYAFNTEHIVNSVPITNPTGTNANDTPVNLNISLSTTAPTTSISGNILLTIDLTEVDAEGTTEFFYVYSEDSTLIGQTYHTPTQCGNSSTTFTNIPIQQLSKWMADGSLQLILISAGSGEDAINNICPNASVTASLSFDYATPNAPLAIQYTINQEVKQNWPNGSIQNFNLGMHTIQYFAEDCSGNKDSCHFQIQVIDTEPPVINCPTDTTIYLAANQCQETVLLPYPLNITDNCSFSSNFDYQTDTIPITFTNNGNAGIIPQTITIDIPGVAPNAINDAIINIQFKGDNANPGEHFLIYGENNTYLGKTLNGSPADECSNFTTTAINLARDDINDWAIDGHISIQLIPETDAGTYSDFINPCGNLNPNQTDGTTNILLTINYEKTTISFEIEDTSGYVLAAKPISLDLNPGVFPVKYSVFDNSGLNGSCQWSITVLDTIAPIAIALNTNVTVNPSGTTTTNIDPNIVNNGSFDNCLIDTMFLTPATFTCDQAGNTLPIVLTVIDISGNIGHDTALVQVNNEPPNPVFTQGVCGNDTLFLFANPPASNGGNVYNYQWSGPNGFSSQIANPIIPSPTNIQTGSYSVTITGLSGCTSTNSVQVQLNALPTPPVLQSNTTSVCPGESILLNTQGYAGSTVIYNWYQGLPPNGNLIGSTNTNALTIQNPIAGQFNFYTVVNINGCNSPQSNIISIIVNPEINLTVINDTQDICQGEQVHLGILNPSIDIQYNWTGPLFSSNNAINQFQATNTNQSGLYIISATKDGCIYQPDTTIVTIHETPVIPTIASIAPLCENDTLSFNVLNYLPTTNLHWLGPNNIDTLLQSSNLVYTADLSLSGSWSVIANNGMCESAPTQLEVFVNKNPVFTIEPISNVCKGNPMTLSYSSTPSTTNQFWSGPNGFSSIKHSPTTIASKGTYYITGVTGAGCKSNDSIFVDPIIPPKITAISNTSDGCYNGQDIQLKPTIFPPNSSYSYQWTADNSFTAIIPEPFIPNANENINGYYYLIVTDTFGCQSTQQSTFVNGSNIPVAPKLPIQPISVCDGEAIQFSISNQADYSSISPTIQWLTPKGTITNSNFTFSLAGTNTLDEGLYYAIVSDGNCHSDTSQSIYITIKPRPSKPVATSNSPICTGEELHLSTNQIFGAQYFWTGPQGNIDSLSQIFIPNIQQNQQGNYFVQTSLENCLSEKSNPVNVVVKELPTKPIIDFISPICFTGGEVNLQITNNSQVLGGEYTWLNAIGDTIGNTSFFTKYITNNLTDLPVGPNQFSATVQYEGCTNSSDPVTVQIDEIPVNQANAGFNISTCAEPIELHADWPSNGVAEWSQVCGDVVTITNPDNHITSVTDIFPNAQYCFEWSLSFGGCKNYSRDTVIVDFYDADIANAGDFIDTCHVTSLFLDAEFPQNAIGKWSQPQQQANTGSIKIIDTANPQTEITGLEKGKIYTFYWTLQNDGCAPSVDSVKIRIASSIPNAGQDLNYCSLDSCITLNAEQLTGMDNGSWSTYDSSADILNPTSETSVVCHLSFGANPLVWTINNASCGSTSKDTVIIYFEPTPVANPDTFDLEYGLQSIIDVSTNDLYHSEYTINITSLPNHCKVKEANPDGKIKLEPHESYLGLDYLSYQICNETCESCTETTVELRIGAYADCKVPNIFTPDQDGINDYLIIPCLLTNDYSESELSIFNQWGDEIYHAKDYKNNWDGIYRGANIQEGTYYYIFTLGDGSSPKKGFITVKY